MSLRLIDYLLSLSQRERLLLGLAALVAVLGLGLGLLLPLQERRHRAETTLTEALALEVWLRERIAEKQSLNGAFEVKSLGQALRQPLGQPIGTSGIEQGLISARLRPALSALAAQADGVIELRFDRVDFTGLANWISSSHPAWGYRLDSFRLEALEGAENAGRIAAWITLTPTRDPAED